MRPVAAVLLAALILSPGVASAEGGFADFLRALTGALGGGRSDNPARRSPVTATIGVRGMDEGGAVAAAPAVDDLRRLDGWAANRPEAEAAARRRGVSARNATLGGR